MLQKPKPAVFVSLYLFLRLVELRQVIKNILNFVGQRQPLLVTDAPGAAVAVLLFQVKIADPDGVSGRNFVTEVVALGANLARGVLVGFLKEILVPFILALEHECAVLQKDALDKAAVFRLLHLYVDAVPVGCCRADVKAESLGLREKDVHFGVLHRNGDDALFALQVENSVQEAHKSLGVVQENLECHVVERVQVGAFFDFFIGQLFPVFAGCFRKIGKNGIDRHKSPLPYKRQNRGVAPEWDC